jgi:hypothetical protein
MDIRMSDKHNLVTDAVYVAPAPLLLSLWNWWQAMGIHDVLIEFSIVIAIIAAIGRCVVIWREVLIRDDKNEPPRKTD